MKESGFPIPIEEIATKTYVDEKVDRKFHIFMEKVDDGFKILTENQQGLAEHLERFELETSRNFKFCYNRLDSITIGLGNLDDKFGELENRFDDFESKFFSFESKFSSFENKFFSFESKFLIFENKFFSLESKFPSFENKFFSLENKFDIVISEIRELKEKIER